MKKKLCILIALLFLATCLFPIDHAQAATKKLKLKATHTSLNSVKLTWKCKNKSIKKWEVQIAIYKKNGKRSAFKTVKTLKKKKRSFTVKYLKEERRYCFRVIGYQVIGYKKAKKKWKKAYVGTVKKNTGLAVVDWDDYAGTDAYTSPTQIDLRFEPPSRGIKPSGYILYRKSANNNGEYQRFKILGSKATGYKDKDVKPLASYRYCIRSFVVIGKNTYYSRRSADLLRSAVNQTGTYDCEIVEKGPSHLVVHLTADAYNADLKLIGNYGYSAEDYDEDLFGMVIKKWSPDGKLWYEAKGTKNLSEKQSCYFYMTSTKDLTDMSRIDLSTVEYNGLPSALCLQEGYGMAYALGESIH